MQEIMQHARSEATLLNFDGVNGDNVFPGLVVASDGILYGSTWGPGQGTIWIWQSPPATRLSFCWAMAERRYRRIHIPEDFRVQPSHAPGRRLRPRSRLEREHKRCKAYHQRVSASLAELRQRLHRGACTATRQALY